MHEQLSIRQSASSFNFSDSQTCYNFQVEVEVDTKFFKKIRQTQLQLQHQIFNICRSQKRWSQMLASTQCSLTVEANDSQQLSYLAYSEKTRSKNQNPVHTISVLAYYYYYFLRTPFFAKKASMRWLLSARPGKRFFSQSVLGF